MHEYDNGGYYANISTDRWPHSTFTSAIFPNATPAQPLASHPSYVSLRLVSADNGIITNQSDAYLRNWTLIFSQGPSRDEKLAALQHFVALMEVYYTPTLATFGLATNILLVCLAAGGRMKALTMAPFIFTLALADIFFLTAQLILWIDKTQATEFQSAPGVCQGVKFLLFVGNFLSIWFVICIQVERYISMWHISRRPQPGSARRSTFIACSIGLLGLLLYSCVIWTSGHIRSLTESKVCTFLPKYYDVLRIFTKADTMIAVLMPYSMLPVLNLLVLIQVLIKAATVRRHTTPSGVSRTSARQESLGYVGSIRQQVQCTASFLAITSIVWVLAMPAQAMRMKDFFRFDPHRTMSPRDQVYIEICNFPHTLSFAIKFMLYLTFSALFRDAVLDCCRWCECTCGCKTESESAFDSRNHMSPIPSSINSPLPSPPPSPKQRESVSEVWYYNFLYDSVCDTQIKPLHTGSVFRGPIHVTNDYIMGPVLSVSVKCIFVWILYFVLWCLMKKKHMNRLSCIFTVKLRVLYTAK